MARLFAYGTLMCPEIVEKIAGMQLTGVPGRVKNHRRLCIRGEHYPGMVQGQGSEVEGLIYTFPSYLWARFDAFEGGQYMRKPVTVRYGNGRRELIHSYIFRPEFRHLLSRKIWDYEAFLRDGREAFMAGYAGWVPSSQGGLESAASGIG